VPVRLAAASQKPFNGLPRAEAIIACGLVGGNANAMKFFPRIRMIVSIVAGSEGGR
jgi:hypothetical protein